MERPPRFSLMSVHLKCLQNHIFICTHGVSYAAFQCAQEIGHCCGFCIRFHLVVVGKRIFTQTSQVDSSLVGPVHLVRTPRRRPSHGDSYPVCPHGVSFVSRRHSAWLCDCSDECSLDMSRDKGSNGSHGNGDPANRCLSPNNTSETWRRLGVCSTSHWRGVHHPLCNAHTNT